MQFDKYKTVRDEEIIKLIVDKGEKELFTVLYNRYSRKVHDKSYSLLKNKDLADEATQNILERTYEKLGSFKGRSSFSSWLYSITYNYCIDYLRNKKKMSYPEWNRQQEMPDISDTMDPEEEDLINNEKLNIILEKIHPEEKALLLMKYNDDISISNIAKALRLTESATKMRIKRARARVLHLYYQAYKINDR